MNYFELYPGDYLKATGRLTLAEHGAYLRLLMEYYATEQPLPEDYDELYVIASAIKPADRAAVKKVADRYFPIGDDGLRHNERADAEIEKAQRRMAASRQNGAKGGRPRKPQQGAGENPAGIPTGIPLGTPAKTYSGEALQTPHAIQPPDTPLGADTTSEARAPATTPPAPGEPTTAAGRACLAMRRGGIAQTNPSHPALLAAIAEGATDAMWEHTAREAVGHNPPKGFAWVIATVRGRLADAANLPTGAAHGTHRQPSPAPRLSAADRVLANVQRAQSEHGDAWPDEQPADDAIPGEAVRLPG